MHPAHTSHAIYLIVTAPWLCYRVLLLELRPRNQGGRSCRLRDCNGPAPASGKQTMQRKLNDDQLRALVRARLTKGGAFMLDYDDYQAQQTRVREALIAMSREEIFAQYPDQCYDVRR